MLHGLKLWHLVRPTLSPVTNSNTYPTAFDGMGDVSEDNVLPHACENIHIISEKSTLTTSGFSLVGAGGAAWGCGRKGK